ncbi:DoxX family membrane protein [Gracilibacillus xinjiangensis]|uniref:DoxX family membrane protein n=1 Tax=Gracilibacillus xinjiangensis TaxID=1193282 RepID=A0ABV8WW82_9BACI
MIKIIMHVSRLFLGAVFLIAGVNGYFVYFDFEPFITTSPEAMALFEFRYLLFIEKTLEIICGILLLINQFTPLALIILAPIIINIILLHIFMDPSLLALAVLLFLAHGYLIFYYRRLFLPIITRNP